MNTNKENNNNHISSQFNKKMEKIVLKLIGPDFKCTMSVLKKTKILEIRSSLKNDITVSLLTLKFSHKGNVLCLEDQIGDLNLTNPNVLILHISIEGETLIGLYKGYYLGESHWNSEHLIHDFNAGYEDKKIEESIRNLEKCLEIFDLMNIGKCGVMKKELISFFSDKKRNGTYKFHAPKNSDPQQLSDYFIFTWFNSIAALKKFNYEFDDKDGFINYDAKFLYDQITDSKNRYISLH